LLFDKVEYLAARDTQCFTDCFRTYKKVAGLIVVVVVVHHSSIFLLDGMSIQAN